MKTVLSYLCFFIIVFSVQDCECGVACPQNCSNCNSGRCLGPCTDPSQHDEICNRTCPKHCAERCNSSGICPSCSPGYRGDGCNITCSPSCNKCERYEDKCLGQCKDPLQYGEFCNRTCPHPCADGCNSSGVCYNCTAGYRGEMCNIPCSTTCLQCERYGGRCVGECPHPHYYGDLCDKSCPETCANGCDRDTGFCVGECLHSQHYGDHCNMSCPDTCVDGCDRDTGSCKECPMGHMGPQCAPIDTEENKQLPGGNFGLVAVPCILTAILVVLIVWSRRNPKRASIESKGSNNNNGDSDSLELKPCKAPSRCHTNPTYGLVKGKSLSLVNYCEHLQGNGDDLDVDFVFDEFSKLPKYNIKDADTATQEMNYHKNRYKDVLPFDDNRVLLEADGDEEGDYINASYINGYRQITRYVAAQGPNQQMVDTFWRMIWQLKTLKIVMLTNLVETGKVKCDMYWPWCGSEYQKHGEVCVQCVEESVHPAYTIRTLAVWKGSSETRTIRQFHLTTWPDHGVPEDVISIVNFHRVVKDTGPCGLGPMLVHCSAGVGRSGTFLALDYLLDEARYEGRVCVFSCVHQFRLQRMKMVQTKDQYKFVYDVLSAALQYRGTLPQYYSPVMFRCGQCWEGNSAESNGATARPDSTSWNDSEEERYTDSDHCSIGCVVLNEDTPSFPTSILAECDWGTQMGASEHRVDINLCSSRSASHSSLLHVDTVPIPCTLKKHQQVNRETESNSLGRGSRKESDNRKHSIETMV